MATATVTKTLGTLTLAAAVAGPSSPPSASASEKPATTAADGIKMELSQHAQSVRSSILSLLRLLTQDFFTLLLSAPSRVFFSMHRCSSRFGDASGFASLAGQCGGSWYWDSSNAAAREKTGRDITERRLYDACDRADDLVARLNRLNERIAAAAETRKCERKATMEQMSAKEARELEVRNAREEDVRRMTRGMRVWRGVALGFVALILLLTLLVAAITPYSVAVSALDDGKQLVARSIETGRGCVLETFETTQHKFLQAVAGFRLDAERRLHDLSLA
ncbi:hypothetical protein MKZ38_008934 [Zalerion maritima]|uniref:Uncharacterized protein n=1 Tax=Zalerion maritima TaxID=339359 RepID=A0AAD5RKG0_9PEZI|nr:hypothetical protein MKZ38_008934 [Zalerion maritima]